MVKARSLSEHATAMTSQTTALQKFVSPLQLHTPAMTVDHTLVSPGAQVAVLCMDEGQAALAYARARPHWSVTGWVPDMKALLRSQSMYESANLLFDKQPVAGKRSAHKVDAILAVAWAHRVYSDSHYHLNSLFTGLQELLAQLPKNGQLLLQDVALPETAEEFVVIEIEDPDMALALEEFAQIARPNISEALQGFFLESLPVVRAGIRRFRLTAKWATEFFHRWRLGVSMESPQELTTLTLDQWAQLVEQCGARAVYRAPHRLSDEEVTQWKKQIRFFDALEQPQPLPPASFTLLIEKIEEAEAVTVYERRPSLEPPKNLLLKAPTQGPKWVDVAQSYDDVLVWRRDAEGHLRLWLQADVPCPIINTVPRGTANLDGRRWAGYLVEPLVLPTLSGTADEEQVLAMLQNVAGMGAKQLVKCDTGVNYYPAPEYLAQRVRGLLVQVTGELPSADRHQPSHDNPGRLIEVLAEDVLQALSAGLIGDSKLEILIGALLQMQGDKPAQLGAALEDPKYKKAINKMVRPPPARVVAEVKTSEEMDRLLITGHTMRCMRSVFVADQAGPMGRQALHVTEDDFIVPEKDSANTAVCIPLIRNPMGRFLLADQPRKLPVPNRMGDSEPMQSLPSFRLPESVTTMDEARLFLGQKLGIEFDDITAFGPSFFLQPHLSPERVYPFLIHAPVNAFRWDRLVRPAASLARYYDRPVEKSRAYVEFKTRRDMGEWYTGLTPDITADITARVVSTTHVSEAVEMPLNDNQAVLKPHLS